ncbi:MAG: type II secretion system GspH family protein [Muribaculaceae bacterium]|nr:type II secretion system GspH family protein [Muribaculaceae bacterium]
MLKYMRGLIFDNRNCRKGFTLTEVLLAVTIVGILAALVLPMVVKNFQSKALESAAVRLQQTLQLAVKNLLVNENVDSFKKTVLYTSEASPTDYANTSGAFIKKYLKVARYCGNSNGDCFADKYYTYSDHEKTEYTPNYKGACATLKNGASICMTPQSPNSQVVILMDINGKKGPNVLGKDLRSFTVGLSDRSSIDRSNGAISWNPELVNLDPVCDGELTEECCEFDFVEGCCAKFPTKYASRCKGVCTADYGSDEECCGVSGWANTDGRKKGCCYNHDGFFEKNEDYCCNTANVANIRCLKQVEEKKDVNFEIELVCGFNSYTPMRDTSCNTIKLMGDVRCEARYTNAEDVGAAFSGAQVSVNVLDAVSGSGNFAEVAGPWTLAQMSAQYFSATYYMSGGYLGGGMSCTSYVTQELPDCSLSVGSLYLYGEQHSYLVDGISINPDNPDFIFTPYCNKKWDCVKSKDGGAISCTLSTSKPTNFYGSWY